MIELVRIDQIDAALAFATTELAPRGAQNPQFLIDLERAMALLTFPDVVRYADDISVRSAPPVETIALLQDPAFVPIMALMKKSYRLKVAIELNAAVLESQGQGIETKLSGLVRLMAWGEERLERNSVELPLDDKDRGRTWARVVLDVL
jgi:hypothetical protein